MLLTKDQLKSIMFNASAENIERFHQPLNEAMEKYAITTPARMAPFLAQVAHESGCLKYTLEIASGSAYEGRADLGNIQKGDGVKFKGRGLIQITGRNNYITLSEEFAVRLTDHPELLEGPVFASLSAAWFWKWRGLNDIADKPETWTRVWKGKTYSKFEWITVKINGGLNGLADRLRYYEKAKETLHPPVNTV